jgi:hypothetical protein
MWNSRRNMEAWSIGRWSVAFTERSLIYDVLLLLLLL